MIDKLCDHCHHNLEYVPENEPYSGCHLICENCDSTYNLVEKRCENCNIELLHMSTSYPWNYEHLLCVECGLTKILSK